MKSLKRQQGLSLIGVTILLFLIIFFGLLTIRMSGSYMDHFTLMKMIDTALEGQTAARFDANAFEDRVKKNMEINNISVDFDESIKVDTRARPPKITVDYERRVGLMFNVDVVMAFHKEYEL